MITDEMRALFLKNRGYTPTIELARTEADRQLVLELGKLDSSAFVTRCIDMKFCPAYWRECKTEKEVIQNMPPNGNGMVFVKAGDRNRIDQCITDLV